MGYLVDTSEQINVVASGLGRGQFAGRQYPKTRIWILEDRTGVLIVPSADGRGIERETYEIESGTHLTREKKMVVNMKTVGGNEDFSPLVLDMKGCGCGFGIVANTPPVDGPHRLSTVRLPDWFEEK